MAYSAYNGQLPFISPVAFSISFTLCSFTHDNLGLDLELSSIKYIHRVSAQMSPSN